MSRSSGKVKRKNGTPYVHPAFGYALLALLILLLAILPMDTFLSRILAIFVVLLSLPVSYFVHQSRVERRLAPIRNTVELLNQGKLQDIRLTDPLQQQTPLEAELARKLVLLSLNIQGLLSHLNRISSNIRTVSSDIDDQLVTYIRDVKHQITNTDVTIQSADEIQGFIRDITENVNRLNDIAMETLSFLKEIVQSNENVNIKMESLSAYVRETEESMKDIIAHTGKVGENAENLSSMVVETSTSVMEMDATISEIKKQARHTLTLAEEAMGAADEGLEQTRETAGSVDRAGATFDQVRRKIRELKENSMRIGEIISTIRKISEQTSLLALNATIYTSRGEADDRNMSVIADKIRELANSSSLAMKEVSQVLTSMQQQVDEGHELVEEGDKVVRDGVFQVRETNRRLEQIVDRLQSVNQYVATVSNATDEHAEGSSQITRATQQISTMTEEIAALMARQNDIVQGVSGKTVYVGQLVDTMKGLVGTQTGKTQRLLDQMKNIGHETRRVMNQSEELELNNRKILNAIRNIRDITDGNYRNTSILSRSAVSLDKYAWHLSNRLKTFNLPDPQHGGTLKLAGLPLAHNSLDPLFGTTVQETQILSLMHAGLVKYDPMFNLIPDVAQSWEVSQDGRRYTFHLRPNVIFHNGQELSASDVVASMKRLLDPAFKCPIAGQFSSIVGADEFRTGDSKELSGVQAVDELTVSFELKQPLVFFTDMLALSQAAIVPQTEYLKGADTPFSDVGCGPFRVAQFEPGKQLVVRRHDAYHRGDRPYLSKVIVELEENPAKFDDLAEGRLDLLSVSEPGDLAVVESRPELRENTMTATQLSTFFIAINCNREPFNQPIFRRALSMAIDRERICRTFPLQLAEPAWCVLPPGLLGHNPGSFRVDHDPEKAKWLLQQNGFDFETEVELTFAKTGEKLPSDIAVIAENFSGIGLNVKLNGLSPHWPYIEALKHMMFRVGWIADYPDSDSFIYNVFHSSAGDTLFMGFSNEEVDRLSEKARYTMDPRQRLAFYERVERIVADESPLIPLYHKKEAIVKSPRLGRILIKGFAPFMDTEDLWFHRM